MGVASITLRFRQGATIGLAALEDAVDENSVSSATFEKEVAAFVDDFEMNARDEARTAHIYVDVARIAIATDRDDALAHVVLEFASFESSERQRTILRRPVSIISVLGLVLVSARRFFQRQ